jgi:protein-S-isoprenylcysteine O-methyltransferase Ste14
MGKGTPLKLILFLIFGALAYYAANLDNSLRLIIGLIIGIPSFALMITSRVHLGKAFSVMPAAKGLVTSGLYSKIRHPLYFFIDFFFLSIIILIGIKWLLFIWLVLIIMQTIQSHREEKVLADAYGAEYEKYKAGTWF